MSHVLHRNMNSAPPLAHASRLNFFLHEAAPVFDLSSGAGVTGFGHTSIAVKQAIIQQLHAMPYAHSGQWTSRVVEEAADSLLDASGPTFNNGAVTFYSGGAEAIEAAVKIAMQYVAAFDGDNSPPPGVIARRFSYHGNTMFTLALGDHPRKLRLKRIHGVEFDIGRFAEYAPHLDLNKTPSANQRDISVAELADLLNANTKAGRMSIVVIETIGGTTVGIAPPHYEYLARIRALCDAHCAVLIYDEVLSGNFRTGEFMAWQYYQAMEYGAGNNRSLAPDIVVMGKGIAAGYFPISCVMVNTQVATILRRSNDPTLWHTSTNQNHPTGCAAVVATMHYFEANGPLIQRSIDYVANAVVPAIQQLPHVHSMQGQGLLYGICFDPTQYGLHRIVKQQLFDAGISVYSDGATYGDGLGNMIMFAPPFHTGPDQFDTVIEALRRLRL